MSDRAWSSPPGPCNGMGSPVGASVPCGGSELSLPGSELWDSERAPPLPELWSLQQTGRARCRLLRPALAGGLGPLALPKLAQPLCIRARGRDRQTQSAHVCCFTPWCPQRLAKPKPGLGNPNHDSCMGGRDLAKDLSHHRMCPRVRISRKLEPRAEPGLTQALPGQQRASRPGALTPVPKACPVHLEFY